MLYRTKKKKTVMKKIETGKMQISVLALLAIWSVSAITSLPGLAISPIMGDLETVFPHTSDLEIQMLSSLPSMLVIPFLFLSGRLSASKNKVGILLVGLTIFLLSGVSYFFISSMLGLIVVSCILGVGAGIVIPLSTGLIAEYFDGRYRTQQLGISSGINNLTLVVATYVTGWLANINWHAPFVVYCLPLLSIVLCYFLPKSSSATIAKTTATSQQPIDRQKLLSLMLLYFFVTYSVLSVPLNLPFLMEQYKMSSEMSGTVISVFFLAITIPGFFITRILDKTQSSVNWLNLLLMAIGLIIIFFSRHIVLFIIGSVLAGFGYGVIQPLIYDKTAKLSASGNVIMALAFVMSMNYLAVLISPFIIKMFEVVFSNNSPDFIFVVNSLLCFMATLVALKCRKGFAFGK